MNLPVLGTLSALFSDAGSEFKKLLEPWALVAAAIFLGLGLAFIYLPLRAGSALLLAWEAWPTAWQLIVATVILFALAYLINTLSGAFLALAGGQLLRDTPGLGRGLRRLQARRFNRLQAQIAPGGGEASNRAFHRLAYEFPAPDVLAPTLLGNVRAATAGYSMNQYGAHLETVWPLVALTLAREDERLLEQLRAEQTATTFLVTLAVLLAVVGVAAAPLALAGAAWLQAVAALALLPLAYGLYRAAAVRALNWGRLIRAALDLYLNAAGDRLGLRPLDDPAAAKARWAEVSSWLAFGGLGLDMAQVQVPVARPGWYGEAAAASPATVTCSTQLSATVHATRRHGSFAWNAAEARLPLPVYDVLVLASAESGAGSGGFLLISDTRLPFVPPNVMGSVQWPDGTGTTLSAAIRRDLDGPEALLWRLPDLAQHGAAALSYSVAGQLALRAGPGVALLGVAPAPSNPDDQLAVTLRLSGPGPATVYAEPLQPGQAGDSFQWAALVDGLPGAPAAATVDYHPLMPRATWAIPDAAPGDYFLVLTLTGHKLL